MTLSLDRMPSSNVGPARLCAQPVIQERMYNRLRQPSAHTVPGSLPVLFFGDICTAQVATIGLNPSWHEYLDGHNRELDGEKRRFETLRSLGASTRDELTSEQCTRAIGRMRGYFKPGKPVYPWFSHLDRVVSEVGYCYSRGDVVHLDLVQEATYPTWSKLRRKDRRGIEDLLIADLSFLQWQLETFALSMLLCNGRTTFEHVCGLVRGRVLHTGKLHLLTWCVGQGMVRNRPIRLVWWNLPLAQPTGLGNAGETQLGRLLRDHLL